MNQGFCVTNIGILMMIKFGQVNMLIQAMISEIYYNVLNHWKFISNHWKPLHFNKALACDAWSAVSHTIIPFWFVIKEPAIWQIFVFDEKWEFCAILGGCFKYFEFHFKFTVVTTYLVSFIPHHYDN